MLKVLVKKQLMEIFRSYFYNAKKNKAYSKSATAAYVVLFVMHCLHRRPGASSLLTNGLPSDQVPQMAHP